MSITSALGVASSGMSLSSRRAETAASNIANADNPGYARRLIAVSTDVQGMPRVSVIGRAVDSSLDAMYRSEVSRTATQDAVATGLSSYTDVLGDNESSDTVLTRLTRFQNALGLLSVSPADAGLQRGAVTEAQGLTQALNRAGDALTRTVADTTQSVQADVATINASLTRLQGLNDRVGGGPSAEARLALEDEIATELDSLAELTDFTLRTDSSGQVELFTTGGTALLVDNQIEALRYDLGTGELFAGAIEITPGQTGVRGNSEGSLTGKMSLLSDTLPEMQAQLDQAARALITGMTEADSSLAAGAPGLFTDAGAALTDPFAPGLASRIAVNAAVLPDQGGAYWRMRDGMDATAPGAAGDNSLIEAMGTALSATTDFDAAAGLGESDTLADYMATLIASQNTSRSGAESAAASLAAGAVAVESTRSSFSGVNLDDELQQLAAIQQSYAANARVLTIAAEMIDTLLGAS